MRYCRVRTCVTRQIALFGIGDPKRGIETTT
ncbi:hypothetical protein SAMN05444841_101166 [Enterobacter kobei]|nr:hypothetical protein SAMN05444841_101166 [Enterobacter kobei]